MIQPASSKKVDLVINRISKEDFYALSASGGISGDLSNQLWMTPGSADGGGSDISVHPVLTSGVHIATLSVDDVETKLYAPSTYALSAANAITLGGIKVDGRNLVMDGDFLSAKDTTYTAATTSKDGLMTSADKSRLYSIDADKLNSISFDIWKFDYNGGSVTKQIAFKQA